MGFGKVRTIIQQRIEDEYLVLKNLICNSDDLFNRHLQEISEAEKKEVEAICEKDPEVRLSIEYSIMNLFEYPIYHHESVIYASRRIFLVSIFSYYEGCLNDIVRYNNIQIKSYAKTHDILESIEKLRGELPSHYNVYKDLVQSEIRVLRNLCTHQNDITKDKALNVINKVNKKDILQINDGEFLIKQKDVLIHYLNSVKDFLEILDNHCKNKNFISII